jgi:hypothetical protein
LSASEKPVWLRLRVERAWPLNSPGSATYEPFRSPQWQSSAWLGDYIDQSFPFVFSSLAGWLLVGSNDGTALHLWHPQEGWLFSTSLIFPIAYKWESAAWVELLPANFGQSNVVEVGSTATTL